MKIMAPNQTIGRCKPRAGEEYRANAARLFCVDNAGCCVHTREGLCGPFDNKDGAKTHVTQLIHINRSDSAFVNTVEL